MNTRLLYECQKGNLSKIKTMVIHYDSEQLGYALIQACSFGFLDIVEFLIENGADPSVDNNMALITTCQLGHTEILKRLLCQDKVNPSACKNKALNYAVESRKFENVKLLLDVGCNPNGSRNIDDDNVVAIASLNKDIEIVQLLIDAGADVINNNQAIKRACYHGYTDIVKLLLENGADPSADDNFPIIWAGYFGFIDTMKLLLEAGAEPMCRGEWLFTPRGVATEVRELLNQYKYKVDGKEYQKMVNSISSLVT